MTVVMGLLALGAGVLLLVGVATLHYSPTQWDHHQEVPPQ